MSNRAAGWIRAIGVVAVAAAMVQGGAPSPAVAGEARSPIDDSRLPASAGTQLGIFPGGDAGPVSDGTGASVTDRGYLVWDGRGPWGGNVKSLVPDPAGGARVLCAAGLSAAREAGGVWRSEDGGSTWEDTDLADRNCNMAGASPSEPGVFYAAAYDGLYRSVDSGAHWAQIAFTSQIIAIGVKVDDGDVLIAGLASNQGIRRSTDHGVTWQSVGMNSAYMKGYAASPAAPERMYIAMSSASSSCFRSDDGGAGWSPAGPAGTDGWGLWVDPADADRLFLSTSAGVQKSTNGGANWSLVLAGTCYANVSVKDGVIYAPMVSGPGGAGVYESVDDGASWTNYNGGITASFFYCSASTSTGVLAGHYGGIYRADAPASAWVVSQTGLNNAYVRTIAYYADRNELWAGTDQSGVWRSTDRGETWELKSAGLGDWATYRLTPRDHEHGQGDTMFITTYTGLYRSTDHGEVWQQVGFSGQFMRGVLIDPADPSRVWVGGAINQQIWRSEDGGDSWAQVGQGISGGFYPDFNMGRSPANGPRLFVNYEQTTNRIYYSDDLGSTFTASTGLESTTYQPALTIRDAEPRLVFCATDAGVYRSTDFGATWAPGGLTGLVWSLLGTRTVDLYAGRNRAGVYASPDDGVTWTALNAGIETLVIWDLAYGATTTDLYCSPRGHGVKALSLLPPTAVEDLPVAPALAAAPNPFQETTAIRFASPLRGDSRLQIIDATGRLIRAERIAAGSRVWTWDGTDAAGRRVPSGTYFYQVSGGGEPLSGRWVMAR